MSTHLLPQRVSTQDQFMVYMVSQERHFFLPSSCDKESYLGECNIVIKYNITIHLLTSLQGRPHACTLLIQLEQFVGPLFIHT